MPDALTIVFSGLMIFHEDKTNNLMEIGIVREPTHVPRILTITNGVLANVFDLRSRPELGNETNRTWRLEVTNPTKAGISIYTNGSKAFNRETHEDDRDFRWGTDFEGADFYDKDLTDVMLTKKLMPVLQIPHGEFYTRLKSPPLKRREDNGPPKPFGSVAGVTGCDILIEGGSASLKVVADDTDLFSFKTPADPLPANTIFEITNTPPDVLLTANPTHGHGTHGVVHRDHFQFYYDLLFEPQNTPSPRFEFESSSDQAPAPDPRLCGKGLVGVRGDPL